MSCNINNQIYQYWLVDGKCHYTQKPQPKYAHVPLFPSKTVPTWFFQYHLAPCVTFTLMQAVVMDWLTAV